MSKEAPIDCFWRSYVISEVILMVSIAMGIVNSPWLISRMSWALAGIFAMVVLTLVPLVPPGRLRSQRRIGTIISGFLSGSFAVVIFLTIQEFKITGGEGPNGEGSPLAAILGVGFFTAVFLIPWTITFVRGMVSWNILLIGFLLVTFQVTGVDNQLETFRWNGTKISAQ